MHTTMKGIGALAVLCGLALTATPAQAELIVLQSNVPGLSAGKVLKDGDAVKIPSGKSAIFVLPTGATKTVSGPVDGKASDFGAGQSRNAALLDTVKKYVQTGGAKSGTVGAMRSASAVGDPADVPFSWTTVPITATGDYCVQKGRPLSLVRAPASGSMELTLVDMQSSTRANIRFDKGTGTIEWPDTIRPEVGKYAFVIKGEPPRQVRLRVIDPLPASDDTLRTLFTQRCESQLQAYIRSISLNN